MARTRRVDLGKERRWRRVMARWRRSGMTARAFCLAQQFKESAFYWWRRELARRDRIQGTLANNHFKDPQAKMARGRSTKPTFVPLRVVNDPSADIEVVLRGGRVLRLRPGFDEGTLRQVIGILEDASC